MPKPIPVRGLLCVLLLLTPACSGARVVPTPMRVTPLDIIDAATTFGALPTLRRRIETGVLERVWGSASGTGNGIRAARGAGLAWYAGVGVGLSIPGSQDLKVKKHNARGKLTHYYFSDDVEASAEPLGTVYVGAWGRSKDWRHLGFEVAASYWRTYIEPRRVIDRSPPGGTFQMPRLDDVQQERVSIYASLFWRFAFFGDRCLDLERRYLYLGAGAGPVYTRVERGHAGWDWAYQLTAGGAFVLDDCKRLRFELRYMVAPDADSGARSDFRVDTSGTRMFPGLAHKDTRFFAIVVALEHRFGKRRAAAKR